MQWHPHNTVAVVIERDQQFLMVEELIQGQLVLNQPAGHLEPGESLMQAARRETLEETAWEVELESLLGIYQFIAEQNGECYLRTCFIARLIKEHKERELDQGIVRAVWMDLPSLQAESQRLRNPIVMTVIEDYLAGRHYPLNILHFRKD
ncbi:MAG: NUDIX hydrolase [Pseudomonadales bacterium]|nr:NUDIX hydrolase [Pseudomonadales bacterium]